MILYKIGMLETLEFKQSTHIVYICPLLDNQLGYLLDFPRDDGIYVDVTIT